MEVSRVHRDGRGPSYHSREEKGEQAQGVQVFDGVKGEAPRIARGGVTQPVGNPPVRYLMNGDGPEEREYPYCYLLYEVTFHLLPFMGLFRGASVVTETRIQLLWRYITTKSPTYLSNGPKDKFGSFRFQAMS